MRSRLAAMAVATTSMVVVAFVLPLGFLVRDMAAQRAVNAATFEAQSIVSVLAAVSDPAARAQIVESVDRRTPDEVTVFLPDGSTNGTPAPSDAAVERARDGEAFIHRYAGGRDVLTPLVTGDRQTLVVRVRVPKSRLQRGVGQAWLLLAAVGLALIVVAVLVAGRLARSIVRPIDELASTARRLEGGDLEARVGPSGPLEVREVGHALNRLAERILAFVAAERESLADLSHRLRTPLTALRLQTENITDPAEARDVAMAVDQLTASVDALIAEARRPSATDRRTADVAAVARDRADFWSALADEQDRTFDVALDPGPLEAAVSPTGLADALDAVLGNVFAHTPEGTAFGISVRETPDGPITVIVDDSGPGFADPTVLERGVSRGGSTGLGLDIARRVIEGSGGVIRLGTSPASGGRVELALPRPGAMPLRERRRSSRPAPPVALASDSA